MVDLPMPPLPHGNHQGLFGDLHARVLVDLHASFAICRSPQGCGHSAPFSMGLISFNEFMVCGSFTTNKDLLPLTSGYSLIFNEKQKN